MSLMSQHHVQYRVYIVARQLIRDRYFDNEPDALRAAIRLIACADAMRRAECMARHPSALAPLRVA
jgi:hypothetical protein